MMKSDRHILSLAILLLFLQLVWLGAELDLVKIPWFSDSRQKNEAPVVGKITNVYNNARQRASSEIAWRDGQSNEEIRAFDALLTLQDSAMKIRLNNGSELSLSENTLVFIEPLGDNGRDERIRIRFAHGSMRSKLGTATKDLAAKSWEITADSAADIQIKTLDSGKIEIEVVKGTATAGNAGNLVNLSAGEVIELGENTAGVKKQISQNMSWQNSNEHLRFYSHKMPATVPLRWQGSVDKVEIYRDAKLIHDLTIAQGQTNIAVVLDEGIYEARLVSQDQVSSWMRMDVWKAPVIHLMSPLPRDRYAINDVLNYIWLKPQEIKTSHWQMSSEENFKSLQHEEKTTAAEHKFTASDVGSYYWRVIGYDSDGFEIPAAYSNSIYFVPNPLSAPRLNKPELRRPAEKKKDGASLLQKYLFKHFESMSLLIEKAHAEDEKNSPGEQDRMIFNSKIHALRLSWNKVEEAEHYILEISEKPDFRTLLVEEKTLGTSYLWKHININSDTFYWRVASGSVHTMGRFSPVAEVNLHDLQIGKDINGVRMESTLTVKKGVTSAAKSAAEPASAPALAQNVKEPRNFYFENPESVLNFGISYENSFWQDSNGTTFRLAGFVENISYRFDKMLNEKWRLATLASLQITSWKNVDSNSMSNGNQTSELRGSFYQLLGHADSPWSLAAGLSFLNLPSRSGLETVKLGFEVLPSVGVFYDLYDKDGWRGKSGFALSANADLYQASALVAAQKTFQKKETMEYVWGTQLEVNHAVTAAGSTVGNTCILGATFGWRW